MKRVIMVAALAACTVSCAGFGDWFFQRKKADPCIGPSGDTTELGVPERVRRLACADRAFPDAYTKLYAATHASADPVDAAVLIVSCHVNDACYEPDERPDSTRGRGESATLFPLAQTLDVDAVEAAIADMGLPDPVPQQFVQRLRSARERMIELAKTDTTWRRVYVVPVQRAVRQWAADRNALSDLRRRWQAVSTEVEAALAADTVNVDHRRRLLGLRADYIATCSSLGRSPLACGGHLEPREATVLLLRANIALKDAFNEEAERFMLDNVPDRSALAYELHFAVARELSSQARQHARYTAARRNGMSGAKLKDEFGATPPANTAGFDNGAGLPPPKFERRFHGGGSRHHIQFASETVKSVSRRKGKALIRFAPHVSTQEDGVGCYETRRVDRVTASGDVIYREKCKRYVKRKNVVRVTPIEVPVTDAVTIEHGDRVELRYIGTSQDLKQSKKKKLVGRVVRVRGPAAKRHDKGPLKQVGWLAVSP